MCNFGAHIFMLISANEFVHSVETLLICGLWVKTRALMHIQGLFQKVSNIF